MIILQVIPNLDAGGAEQSCVDIVAGLVQRGHRALVVSAGGRRVEEIERLGGKHIMLPVDSKNPLVILKNAELLSHLIRDDKVDIIHARSRAPAWSAWLASRKTGIPFVTTFHAAYKFSGKLKKAYNRIMTRGDRIIAISEFIKTHIVNSYDIDPQKIRVVYRCVDLERFQPEAVTEDRLQTLRQAWGINPNQRIVLMPARLSPIKGHKLFIEAMARLFSSLLAGEGVLSPIALIVGDDQGRQAYRNELEELIVSKNLQNRIKLVSHCSDMPAAYRLADAVVVPSFVPEGFGRVPVEAMAMGVPVIASDLGATIETVQDGVTGWRLPPLDPQTWANAINHALNLPSDERARMTQAAQQAVREKFDRRKMIADTLAVYDDVMNNK